MKQISKQKRFEELVSATLHFEPAKSHPLNLLGEQQKKELIEHVDVLENIKKSVDDDEAAYLFNYAVPALMKARGGISQVLKFAERVEAGQNIWAACIAVLPESFFTLLEEFDRNKSFADWVSSSNRVGEHQKAYYDLWYAVNKDSHWSKQDLFQWYGVFKAVGEWDKVAEYNPKLFPLSKKGYAVGVEVEVRNHDASRDVAGEGEFLERVTPHTTNLKATAEYLKSVKQYFTNCERMHMPGYYWNMHLNLSLTKEGKHAFEANTEEMRDIIYKMILPTNTFARNDYVLHRPLLEDQHNIQIKRVKPLEENEFGKRLDKRCPARKDNRRLEMKCCSVWAGTDVDYLMDCIHMTHILVQEHPEMIAPFKQELDGLYKKYKLMTPSDFAAFDTEKTKDSDYTAQARKYEKNSKLFRADMSKCFSRIFSEVESAKSNTKLDFREKVRESKNPENRGRN